MLEINFDPFPEIETARLVLRRINAGDEDGLRMMRSEIDAMKHLDMPFFTRSKEEHRELILKIENGVNANEMIAWAMVLKGQESLIGSISFHRIEKAHYRAEIGYMLSPEFWHKGLMNEAVKAVITYGFEEMKLHGIEAHVNPENEQSINLLERNGFVREGYFKDNYFFRDRFLDTAVYSLLSNSPQSRQLS